MSFHFNPRRLRQSNRLSCFTMAIVVSIVPATPALSADSRNSPAPRTIANDILNERDWKNVEASIDKGLQFLIRQHRADGSFQADSANDPGITGLCVMALLSRGHLPNNGPYSEQMKKSVNFILNSQQGDGLISVQRHRINSPYSHAICALVLSELYGMSQPEDEARIRHVINQALVFTGHRYSQPKALKVDEGSWRYLTPRQISNGDLSVTSWNVMFLRSAKNSGFDVDVKLIEEALAYMKRTYDPSRKTFRYEIQTDDAPHNHTRAMAGAGVLSLSLAGEHHSDLAQNAASYILKKPFDQYVRPISGEEFPCYGAFYCSQGMFQMGGDYWSQFYPTLVKTLLKAQRADGSWIMQQGREGPLGPAYATAMTVLALTPPYQMLPIFQR